MADAKLLPLFSNSVVFTAPSATASVDNYGKRTFASVSSTLTARIQQEDQLIRDEQGRVVQVQGTIYVYETTPIITTDFRCTLPDGKIPLIISTDVVADEDGANHQVIKIGR
jgi:hypothetical protein